MVDITDIEEVEATESVEPTSYEAESMPPLSDLPVSVESDVLERLIDCLDIDGDSQLTASEAYTILATLVQNVDVSDDQLAAFISMLDANSDSRITFVELVLAARVYGT